MPGAAETIFELQSWVRRLRGKETGTLLATHELNLGRGNSSCCVHCWAVVARDIHVMRITRRAATIAFHPKAG